MDQKLKMAIYEKMGTLGKKLAHGIELEAQESKAYKKWDAQFKSLARVLEVLELG